MNKDAKERAIVEQRAKLDEYRKSREQAFEDFRSARNEAYAELLRRKWVWFKIHQAQDAPVIKPIPPVVMPDGDGIKPVVPKPLPVVDVVPHPEPSPEPKPVDPIARREKGNRFASVCFDTVCHLIDMGNSPLPLLAGTDESDVADMWLALSDSQYDNMVADLYGIKESESICDWSFVLMVKEFAGQVCDHKDSSEVLAAYILSQTGFDVRLARGADGSIYLFLRPDCLVLSQSYYNVGGSRFYSFRKDTPSEIYFMEDSYPGTKPVRMVPDGKIATGAKLLSSRHLSSVRYPEAACDAVVDISLIKAMENYPRCCFSGNPNTTWAFYASVPMDHQVVETVYPALQKAIEGKTNLEKVEVILNFVQTAFEYGYDTEIWGGDRPFFAEETIYYPYSDCEDRAILFSRLVRDIVGLEVALVLYPNHLASAVDFGEACGDYIDCEGRRFTICDPTYIGASVGRTMPGMENESAFVMKL
ncbi:MAG: hypothetical protein ACI39U_01400 [Candidatus Cryptobacteroides sp.]